MWHWIWGRSICAGQEGERRRIGIAGLRLEPRPVDGAAIQARRRAGLQPGPVEAEGAQLVAQELGRRLAVAAATVGHLADVGQPVEEGTGGDDHRPGVHGAAVAQQHSGDAPIGADLERRDFRLLDTQVRLLLQHLAHADAVQLLVHLRARRPHGGPRRGIEQAELNPDRIRHLAHDAAESVDLAHQVALGDSADGGVAATSARSGRDSW